MQTKELLAIIAVTVIAVLACAFVYENSNGGNEPDRIGIIGAMEEEVAALKDAMDIDYTEEIASMEFCVGKISGRDVVVVQCGMGKVNAGICAQTLISDFNVKYVINTGVGGSLDSRLNIGDYVVSVDAVQHDFDVEPIGFEKGEIPFTGLYAFKADDSLRQKAVWTITQQVGATVMEGRICTGDQFISTPEQKAALNAEWGGLCCEMEGGAIAQVCYLSNVPFVIIRAVSDTTNGDSPEEYEEFRMLIAHQCALTVAYMIEHFDEDAQHL